MGGGRDTLDTFSNSWVGGRRKTEGKAATLVSYMHMHSLKTIERYAFLFPRYALEKAIEGGV